MTVRHRPITLPVDDMDRLRPTVIPHDGALPPPGPATPGMDRRQLLDTGDRWFGWVRTEPRLAGGWHTHGERDSYIYMLQGTIHVDYGPGGRERVTARAGDLVFNPAHMVHREVTDADAAELFVVRVGPGPLTTNVDGPDPDEA
jgi:quercetin dioxygenase-like cupin family protein